MADGAQRGGTGRVEGRRVRGPVVFVVLLVLVAALGWFVYWRVRSI